MFKNKERSKDSRKKLYVNVMQIICMFSVLIGGIMPLLFWETNNISETNPMTSAQAITFLFLIFSATINIVFGILTVVWIQTRTDVWFKDKHKMFIYFIPLLVCGGAFLIAVSHIYFWRSGRK
jgi:flagellar basal body-associated protein FliL